MKKRYEFSVHTNLSILDGISSIAEYDNYMKENGILGYAVTDRNGLFSFPYLKNQMFGVSLDMIDEGSYYITLTKGKGIISDMEFVVFDLETTGITYDAEIMEIGAVKIKNGKIVDTYHQYIKPKGKISEKSIEITGLTFDYLKDKPYIEDIIEDFISFIGNAALVAHNAAFDYGHIKQYLKNNYLVIDTLQLARSLYFKETKKFYLGALCELFGIPLDNAHSALCDAMATGKLFIKMLDDLKKKNVLRYEEINAVVDRREIWKFTHPYAINCIVKNEKGYKNLLEIISDGYNKHFYGDARFLKSIIEKNREGLLIGSGGVLGSLFQNSYQKNDYELLKELSFYDYIEISHSDSYLHYQEILGDDYLSIIHKGIKRICMLAEKLNKPIIASSNAYYTDKGKHSLFYENVKNPNAKRYNAFFRFENLPYCHVKSMVEWESDLSYLENNLAYIYDNTVKLYEMISFNRLPQIESINKEEITNAIKFAIAKTEASGYVLINGDKLKASRQGIKYFIKCLKDSLGGNRVLFPSVYLFDNELHCKTAHIDGLLGIVSNNINSLEVSPLQYEIMESKENIKVTHFPYDYIKDFIYSLNYEEDELLSLLEALRLTGKANYVDNDLIIQSSFYQSMDLPSEIRLELGWYRIFRPLVFFKTYFDCLGENDFIIDEMKKEGFILLNPDLEKSQATKYVIVNRYIYRPLAYYFNELADEIFASNQAWPFENKEDIILRFTEEVYLRYEKEFNNVLEEKKC